MTWMHVLAVECAGLVTRVTLNDVEVFADWEGASRITQTKLDPYIVEGDNRLDVSLTPMTDDEGRPLGGDRALSVALLRGEHGRDPGDEGRIARFVWNESDTPIVPGTLTSVWGRLFTVRPEHAHGRWTWQDAPQRVPTEDDAQRLVALAAEVHAALVARNVAALRQLTSLRDAEMARALDLTADEMAEELDAYYRGWFEAPDWSMDPFDPAQLAASAFARGRLVRLTDAYGAPALKGFGDGRRFAFQLVATRFGDGWAIVR